MCIRNESLTVKIVSAPRKKQVKSLLCQSFLLLFISDIMYVHQSISLKFVSSFTKSTMVVLHKPFLWHSTIELKNKTKKSNLNIIPVLTSVCVIFFTTSLKENILLPYLFLYAKGVNVFEGGGVIDVKSIPLFGTPNSWFMDSTSTFIDTFPNLISISSGLKWSITKYPSFDGIPSTCIDSSFPNPISLTVCFCSSFREPKHLTNCLGEDLVLKLYRFRSTFFPFPLAALITFFLPVLVKKFNHNKSTIIKLIIIKLHV